MIYDLTLKPQNTEGGAILDFGFMILDFKAL